MHREPTAEKPTPFPDEVARLWEISRKLEQALARAEAAVARVDTEYRTAKRYMADYRGELDPHEMFQTELLLKQTDQTGALAVNLRNKLARLKDSPYFARVDFAGEGSEAPASFYIGRSAFSHENEPLIFDWRAPIATLFYDCEVGPAGYDAPMGRVNGALTRKRQFKIKNGVMEYALESSAQVQDDLLQKELAHTSDEKMKSIIATIQKEQNQIIRNESTGTLIIQGVAGSGKTSIALHRIAFLLYRFKGRLQAQNIAILSPNKVFGDYISNVIPELGEEPVYQLSFAALAQLALEPSLRFAPDKDPLEACDPAWAERVRFKSTLAFVALLDEYISALPGRIFAPSACAFGEFSASAEWLQSRFCAYANYPIRQRLALMAEELCQRFEAAPLAQSEPPKASAILKALTGMLTLKTPMALYKDFYRAIGQPRLFVMPAAKTLEWNDVFPFLYLRAAFEGLAESRVTKHLVVDEMQDYTPIQYAVLGRLFPCPKTILGDFGQFLSPHQQHTLADLRQLHPGAEFVQLNKSYRSTWEIMTFAMGIQASSSLRAMERHGPAPTITACESEQAELEAIKNTICTFNAGENASLCIILKTNKAARELYRLLAPEFALNLLAPESAHFEGGVSVASIQMAKGLEFDQVVVPQANRQNYCSDYDRGLLYIACTRAMHQLSLLHTGERSPLIAL